MLWAIAKASSCVMQTSLRFSFIWASLEPTGGSRMSLLVPHSTIGVLGQCLRSSGTHIVLTFSKDVGEMIEKQSRKTSVGVRICWWVLWHARAKNFGMCSCGRKSLCL